MPNMILTKDKITETKEYKRLKTEFNRPSFKKMLQERKGCICQVCKSTNDIHYHHIVPLFLGGTNDFDNIIPLCHSCHIKAHGGQTMNDFREATGGRKKKKPPRNYKSVLDRYFNCEIGKGECQQLLGITGAAKLTDKWWYKEYVSEKGIVLFRNNIDILMCKRNSQEVFPKQIIGYIEYNRGMRTEIDSTAYLEAHKEFKQEQLSFV